jgi:hypothetical protein
LSKTITTATLLALLPDDRRGPLKLVSQGLRAGQFANLAAAMPRKVEACMTFPSVRELITCEGPELMTKFLEARIIAGPCALMNVAHKMTTAQVIFTAKTIVELFADEPVATIELAMQRGAAGVYGGTFHQLDTSVVVDWIRQTLDEQAVYRVNQAEHAEPPASSLVNYKLYMERRRQEEKNKAAERERKFAERKAEIAAHLAFLERDKLTPDQVRTRLEIANVMRDRFGNLGMEQLNAFKIHRVDGWVDIFAPSPEVAGEILGEAMVRIQLKKKEEKKNEPTTKTLDK